MYTPSLSLSPPKQFSLTSPFTSLSISSSLILLMEEDQFVELHDQDQKVMTGRKRSKRLRLSSSTDSTAGTSGGEEDFSSTWSITMSGEGEDSTEEEEDMANCLILLAQGDCPKETVKSVPRFDEMARTATTKGRFYGYECKTCNRAFPSFQALGGHRASHKKLKLSPTIAAIGEKVKKLSSFTYPDETEEAKFNEKMNPNKGKLRECSICGLEFSSGQALGGHMRRHRAQAATVSDEAKQTKRPNILAFDLNLPAPEDDLQDTMFQFPAIQQSLVFPSPALVDCYY